MTVTELEYGRGTPTPSRELSEWKAFFQIKAAEHKLNEPGGDLS